MNSGNYIHDIQGFPEEGILFKDITSPLNILWKENIVSKFY
ncbi:hypothetical protein [Flavobacterium fluviatile]|nr:hypothetical protein [Flavobacterium fluviatile]